MVLVFSTVRSCINLLLPPTMLLYLPPEIFDISISTKIWRQVLHQCMRSLRIATPWIAFLGKKEFANSVLISASAISHFCPLLVDVEKDVGLTV